MINDLFFRRYRGQIYLGAHLPSSANRLFVQVAHIVFADLAPRLRLDGSFFKDVHDALARELGRGPLFDAPTYKAICQNFLVERYDLWNNHHGTADSFLKARLSFVELLFRAIEERARTPSASGRSLFGRSLKPIKDADKAKAAVSAAISELNNRFREARMGLHYHNGVIQFANDRLTEARIMAPCWELLRDPKWANVDSDLKEALDRADGGRADAAFHAAKALESTIKIISDERGWTTGRERGAAAYIDNLASKTNGRFIESWEAEMLKAFFTHVRNPHGHGPGSHRPAALADYQTAWAIETTMSWIKSLILRS